MTLKYTLLLDDDDDKAYTGDVAVSNNVISFEMSRRAGEAGELRVRVNNRSLMYSPEAAGSAFLRGRWVRLWAVLNGQGYVLFSGMVTDVTARLGYGELVLVVRGALAVTESFTGATVTNASTDEVMTAIMPETFGMARRDSAGVWYAVLDHSNTILDSTVIAPEPGNWQVGTGLSEVAYFGDGYAPGTPLLQVLNDLATVEGGFVWTLADGTAELFTRDDIYSLQAPATTITATDYSGFEYGYGREMVNRVVVGVRDRTVDTARTLWQLPRSVPLLPGYTYLRAAFRDENNDSLPVVGDLTASSSASASNIEVVVTQLSSGAEISVYNPNDTEESLLSLSLSGTPLLLDEPEEYVIQDVDSIGLYGAAERAVSLPAFSGLLGLKLARWIVATRSEPAGVIRSVTCTNHDADLTDYLLGVELGNRVNVAFLQLEHDRDYLITGIAIEASAERNTLKYTLELEPLDHHWPLILDHGVTGFLGQKLGY